jgi:selenocysteine lyase/cysteine desulfurase
MDASSFEDDLTRNERFWLEIGQAFSMDARWVALNANANNSPSRSTYEALTRNLALTASGPLAYQRDVFMPQREIARARLAAMANCSPEEIALTRNTTEAMNIVISGLELQPGDEILTTTQGHPTTMAALTQRAERTGVSLRQIRTPTPPHSLAELTSAIVEALAPTTKVVVIAHVVDPTGQIWPVRAVADAVHARGVQLVVDGALSFGAIEVDLQAMDCDYFGTSLHKGIHAPMGTGFLYVKRERIPDLWPLFGSDTPRGSDIRKFESIGRQPFYQIAAINQAIEFHESLGTTTIRKRTHYLKRRWADQLAGEPNVGFNTSLDYEQSAGIANVGIVGIDPEILYLYLLNEHRFQAWWIKHEECSGLWVSVFPFTRVDQLDRFADALRDVARDGLPGTS